ncbi:nucleotide exchange factor GrpE [uncultured Amnibacterium sp.]|uniref:nucleotide exchange factor GrpE n=1 Tax=uncultured Amnibacterium sp. TaxID=1631851 RepID=UPI0035CC9453
MARRGKNEDPEEVPGDESGTPKDGAANADSSDAATDAAEGMIAAEDADVETSFSDADEAFLADLAAGSVPEQSGTEQHGAGTEAAEPPESEHLADLRRVTAEYANYRRRVERDRVAERERAVGDAARVVLPVLDDLDRAEAHGDLAEGGPLTTIAHKLRAQVTKLGLAPFGEAGETFDPQQHEAIFQRPNPDVQRATVADVVERGYRIGDTLLRVAKVVVDTPEG